MLRCVGESSGLAFGRVIRQCRGGDRPDDIWSRPYSKGSVAISSAFTRELFWYLVFIMAVCLPA
jgi:hypothetical protein